MPQGTVAKTKRVLKSPFLWLAIIMVGLTACTITVTGENFAGDDKVLRETYSIQTATQSYGLSLLRSGDATGQRVIFVHGTPGTASGWKRYLDTVPDGFEFMAIDRPGFGLTVPNKEQVKLDEQAAVLEPLLVERNGKYPILVGHSLGGPIVAAAAANYPDRVGGIIQLAGSVDPAQEDIRFIQYIGELPPVVWMIPRELAHTNKEVFALKDELILLGEKLDQITAPVIIIHGTQDDLVPYENVAYMQRTFTNASPLELVTLDGQNHFLPWNSGMAVKMAIDRIARDFPGGIRPELIVRVENMSETPGFNPQGSIFQD